MKLNSLIILASAIFLASLIISFWLMAFNFNWYDQQFKALGIYAQLPPSRVNAQTMNLFSFLNDEAGLNQSFYSDREINHLIDIKNLLIGFKKISWLVLLIGAGYFLLLLINRRLNLRMIFLSSVSAAGAILSLSVFIALFFNRLFLIFHQAVFSNDYWRLDPATEKLIVIFPPQIFLNLITQISIKAVLICLIIALAALTANQLFFAKPNKF